MKKVQLAKRKHVKVTDTGWGNELKRMKHFMY